MKNVPSSKRIVSVLYWFIVLAFATLGPWGHIDTRDFSYMGPVKFWEYNAYITFILLAMIVLGTMLWRRAAGVRTLTWMAVINTMFLVMVVFDLIHFFPDPAQPLPIFVATIEIVTALGTLGILVYAPRMTRLAGHQA